MTIFDLTIDGRSYRQMSSEEQGAFLSAPPFDWDELDWFASHWLPVTDADISAIDEALAPAEIRCWPLTDGVAKYIGCDLLTDCSDGGSYERAASLLRGLPIVAWTPPPED
jgi:hypothetical protein